MTDQPVIETHKLNIGGVILYVRLDYKNKQISFMDEQGNPQKFEFTKRGRNYLGGWVRIYRALEQATIWADERLATEEKRAKQTSTQKIIDIFTALADVESREEL